MIDVGANLIDKSFLNDLDAVVDRAKSSGVRHVMVTGTDVATSRHAVELCAQYPGYLSSTAGVHPHSAGRVSSGWIDEIEAITQAECVVAVGETGLDYFRDFSPRSDQRKIFYAQLELASNVDMPVFMHDRDSQGDLLQIVSDFKQLKAVVHCFTGSQDLLISYLELGLYIGITGWVCDERRGLTLRKAVHLIPDDKLLVETDAPYLMPRNISPKPKSRRNEPANLHYVIEVLAAARQQTPVEVARFTTNNAKSLFAIG